MDRGGLYAAFIACKQTPCIAEKLVGVDFAAFDRALADYQVLSIYADGEPVGAAIFKDGDGHIAVLRQYRGRWATRTVLREIFREWGAHRRASVDERNGPALDFVRRLGLLEQSRESGMVRFA